MLIRGSDWGHRKLFALGMGKVSSESHEHINESLFLTDAVVSLVNPTIVQNEGDGDVSVCARLDSPVGGTEKEIFITLNNGELI